MQVACGRRRWSLGRVSWLWLGAGLAEPRLVLFSWMNTKGSATGKGLLCCSTAWHRETLKTCSPLACDDNFCPASELLPKQAFPRYPTLNQTEEENEKDSYRWHFHCFAIGWHRFLSYRYELDGAGVSLWELAAGSVSRPKALQGK